MGDTCKIVTVIYHLYCVTQMYGINLDTHYRYGNCRLSIQDYETYPHNNAYAKYVKTKIVTKYPFFNFKLFSEALKFISRILNF